jgi:hypothetical protein
MNDMRKLLVCLIAGMIGLGGSAWGQTHKVTKAEDVVRAVGVYEWTGDLAKPGGSRLIPVSVFINGELQDAGVYMARPVPFALETGNVYELQDSGVAKGFLDLAYARRVSATDATGASAYDDGWFGYGSYKPPIALKKSAPLRASKTLPAITSSASDSKPHLSDKSGSSTQAGSSSGGASGGSASDDSDRPTMKRRTSDSDSGSGSSTTTADTSSTKSSTTADDPDRPTMKRHTSTDAGSSGNTTADAGSSGGSKSASADDPDRPTLKRRSAGGSQVADDTGSSPSLNNDPDRPNLHHGRPAGSATGMTDNDMPKMTGLPADMHQMIAVSDAANRDPHEFARPWEDAAEQAAILAKMQGFARTLLAGYKSGPVTSTAAASTGAGAAAAPAASQATAAAAATDNGPPTLKRGIPTKTANTPAAPKTAGTTTATKSTGTAAARKTAKAAPAPAALMDEQLKGFTLSYGGAATYVYMAHTAGTGADLRYVTIVAQADALGELKPALQSVTDAAHLDRTPWMRLVDVVDVEASNRASLLFEMRAQNSRQFGLYRVIAAKPEQIFLTGSTQ